MLGEGSMSMRRIGSWTLYPALLSGALGVTAWGLAAGGRPSLVVLVVILGAMVPVLLAQRWLPLTADWKGRPADFSLDLLHLGSTGAAVELFRALSLGVLYEAATRLSAGTGLGWPSEAPWVLQVPVALLVGEFFAYWLHRSFHRVPVLWRLHALHHSSERMYALAAMRNHPMNAVLMHACHVLPVALLGAPPEVLALCGVITGVNGLLQHCNVDLEHGPLNWVFATADAHRWHHSADRAESNTNFGNNLIVWDRLFGTVHLPGGHPDRVGLDEGGLPQNFFAQLLTPLVLYRQLRRRV
jgi:ornithine lipid hydroxylase